MWGFRPAQTVVSVPYMLSQGAWFANIVPVFGETWILLEIPFYQWCVIFLSVWLTGSTTGCVQKARECVFAVAILWPIFLIAKNSRGNNGATTHPASRCAVVLLRPWVFWGRTSLIETTTSLFLSARMACVLRPARYTTNLWDWLCNVFTTFGLLAAAVKITAISQDLYASDSFIHVYIFSIGKIQTSQKTYPLCCFLRGTVVLPAAAIE